MKVVWWGRVMLGKFPGEFLGPVPTSCHPTSLMLWNPKMHPIWQESRKKGKFLQRQGKFLPVLWFLLPAGVFCPCLSQAEAAA